MCQYYMAVRELNLEVRVRKSFQNNPLKLNYIIFRQNNPSLLLFFFDGNIYSSLTTHCHTA